VLRDGKYIGTVNTRDVTVDDVIRMMVGRELGHMYPDKAQGDRVPLLEVRNLRLLGYNTPNSFTLYAGEVVGFAGLIGSGRTELARAIFGADERDSGETRRATRSSTRSAICRRIARRSGCSWRWRSR